MIRNKLSSTLQKLVDAVSKRSQNLSWSAIDITCFDLPDFPEGFAAWFDLPAPIALEPCADAPLFLLAAWLDGDGDALARELLGQIAAQLGGPVRTWVPEGYDELRDALASTEDHAGPFTFIEDIFFVEYPEAMVCFILGNFE